MALLVLVGLAAAACTTSPPAPTPAPGPELSAAQVRYVLIEHFGPLTYCDPDEYPVAHGDELHKARQRLPEIRADRPTFAAIADHLGLAAGGELDDAATLAVYREWKRLNAVIVEPVEGGRYAFDLVTETDPGVGRGLRSTGTIDDRLDGASVVSADLADYAGLRTYDVRPAGDTGLYWGNGIRLASTLP